MSCSRSYNFVASTIKTLGFRSVQCRSQHVACINNAAFHQGRFSKNNRFKNCVTQDVHIPRMYHTTPRVSGLMEFFDEEKNWERSTVSVGRSWEKPELRTRSNEELHKLWYVLLKEMNMLLTMQEEYKRICEVMPSPERIEKVEVSLDNVRDIIDERNRAVSMLETGELPHPRWIDDIDELGRPIRRLEEEHLIPKEHNEEYLKKYENLGEWTIPFVRFWNEKIRRRESKLRSSSSQLKNRLLRKYPHLADEDPEFLQKYCDEKIIPADKNPDVEKLIEKNNQD